MVTKQRVDVADISHHQAKVDLKQAKAAGLKGLYHKTSEGDTMVDEMFAPRLKQARALHLPMGGYHFARAEVGDAAMEARRLIRLADPKPGDLIPALDLETSEGLSQVALANWENTFTKVIEDALHVTPVLYSPWSHFANQRQVQWVPRYNKTNTPPEQEWDMWQFSNGVLGVPNQFPGLGHCDLNTFGKGMSMARLLIPKPEKQQVSVPQAHVSCQFSDTDAQKQSDANRIFDRAEKTGLWWITGTEAGEAAMKTILRNTGKSHGFKVYAPKGTDSWIAVRESVLKGTKWQTAYTKVVDGKAGQFTDKGPVSVTFDTVLGTITVITCHYLTHGRPVNNPEYNKYLAINTKLASAIGEVADEKGAGSALVFYGGDQNIVDRLYDTFLGVADLTSCWDELKRWENTGHGNIDVIASYDKDGRVVCKSARALDDTEFPLFTDHYWVEAIYLVRAL